MSFSPPALHPNVIATDEQRDLARSRIEALVSRRPEAGGKRVDDGTPVAIRLTTVSTGGGFDSYIQLRCPLPRALRVVQPDLLVDSGNATLIVPYGEQLTEANGYKLLGTTTEPRGAPAKVVQGPIQIPTIDGTYYEIADCVFYACTGNNMYGTRTANFGLGCLSPWSSQRGNVPLSGKPPLQAPLSYNRLVPVRRSRLCAGQDDVRRRRQPHADRRLPDDAVSVAAQGIHHDGDNAQPGLDVGHSDVAGHRRTGDAVAGASRLLHQRGDRHGRHLGLPGRPEQPGVGQDVAGVCCLSGMGRGLRSPAQPAGSRHSSTGS